MTTTRFVNARLSLGGGRWETGELLVRDGRIVAVGAAMTPDVEADIVDVQGASVLPGFHDTHVHPTAGGASLLAVDLSTVHDADAYARVVGEYAAAHPELPVLTGAGWYGDVFPGGFPTRWLLDAIVSDRPVLLNSHDGHGVWINTRALELAGIAEDATDPAGGRLERDDDGLLTGVLLDTAMGLLDGIRPAPPADHLEAAILAAQQRLHEVGITTWHDAAVGTSEVGPDAFDAYLALDERGDLTARVVLCQWWDRDQGLEQFEAIAARRDRALASRRLRAGVVKIMQDGVIENHTAAMLEPYTDEPDRVGDSFIPAARLASIVTALDAAGFDVHLHGVGDRAVRECLDAVQEARRVNGAGGGRHQIAHLDVVDPADTPRFAALDVTANAQLLWARADAEIVDRKLPIMGPERARHHFPFGALHRAGARIAGGSDWPVSDPNPLWAIHTGTTRLAPSGDPHATVASLRDPLLPDEAIPFHVALDAYTGVAAWVGRFEYETGALEPGLAADLVVLDRDISDGTGLDQAKVMSTWIDGRIVSARPASAN